MNVIEKINLIFLDGKSLTKEDIKKLWDDPTLQTIEEVVWIDKNQCKKIQNWFVEDSYNKNFNKQKEKKLLKASNKIIELSRFYNKLNSNEIINKNSKERHSIIKDLNFDIEYISELLDTLTNDIKKQEDEINMYLSDL